jgi:hypothetical protein
MADEPRPSRSHLFTVRVWREDMGDGQWEWRGKVQHVVSGEVRYFGDWAVLGTLIQTLLALNADVEQTAAGRS